MRNALLVLSAASLAAGAAAQNALVIPSAAATARPSAGSPWTSAVFYSTSSGTIARDSHTQSIYDSSDVNTPFALVQAIQVRRPTGLGNQNPAMTANLTIEMSTSPNPASAASSTFAANHGPNLVQVFNGQISLPQEANPGGWPAQWQAPIVLTTPFPFVQAPGESLVIDIMQTANSATTPWYLEYTDRDLGDRVTNGPSASSCRFSNGNYNSSLGYTRPAIGGSWRVTYGNLLPNVPGIAALGFQGAGGVWGGNPLPLDLTFLGAPGCRWNIEPVASISLVASATGSASWPTLQIPNDPALGGTSFYDHSAWIDPAANAAGLVTGWSSQWIIGTNRGGPGAFVSATGNSAASPTGTLSPEEMPTLQLLY